MEQTGVALGGAAEEMAHVTKAKGTAIAIANAQMASSVVKIIVTVTSMHGINGGAEDMIAVSVGTVSRWLVDFRTQRNRNALKSLKINLTILTTFKYYHCETIAPDSVPETGTGCDGTDWFNIRRCCRYNGPCNLGEGDCNKDSECADGLTCGSNNCQSDFSTGDTWWGRRHDCCIGNKIQTTINTKQL